VRSAHSAVATTITAITVRVRRIVQKIGQSIALAPVGVKVSLRDTIESTLVFSFRLLESAS
jgi:hypothetical protein